MDVYITKLRKPLKEDPSIEIINIHGKGLQAHHARGVTPPGTPSAPSGFAGRAGGSTRKKPPRAGQYVGLRGAALSV